MRSAKRCSSGFPIAWVFWWRSRDGLEGSLGVASKPLPFRPQRADLVAGGLLGLAIVAVIAALYFGWLRRGGFPPEAVAAIRAKVEGIGVAGLPRFVTLGVFYAIGHSLLEEYYWRWFVFGRLQRLTRLPIAVGLSAIGFMAHHVCVLAQFFGWASALTVFFSLSVAGGGVVWALLYRRYQSLYGVWLSHLLVDTGIFAVGYDLIV
ncbi:MAG: CPBP family intramembrane metalloprotease [Planctomycetaceae bacterium]|nr:CPBP family intramembrane metalloprotease [Planctomycetaceae bacterium]